MRELSILEEQLLDEYFRCKRNLVIQGKEIQNYKRGYISYKKIGKKKYPYLQWRDNDKIHSEYIKKENLAEVIKQLEFRNEWEQSIKNLHRSIEQITKALGERLIKEYENEILKSTL